MTYVIPPSVKRSIRTNFSVDLDYTKICTLYFYSKTNTGPNYFFKQMLWIYMSIQYLWIPRYNTYEFIQSTKKKPTHTYVADVTWLGKQTFRYFEIFWDKAMLLLFADLLFFVIHRLLFLLKRIHVVLTRHLVDSRICEPW